MGVWSRGAETGHVRFDQARVQLPQVVRPQAHARRGAGAQVGQQDVRRRRHFLRHRLAVRVARVEAQGAFVDVDVEEIRAAERTRNVAGVGFHLDDVGAQVGKQAAGDGAGDQVGNFQYPDALQGQVEFRLGQRGGRGRHRRRACGTFRRVG